MLIHLYLWTALTRLLYSTLDIKYPRPNYRLQGLPGYPVMWVPLLVELDDCPPMVPQVTQVHTQHRRRAEMNFWLQCCHEWDLQDINPLATNGECTRHFKNKRISFFSQKINFCPKK